MHQKCIFSQFWRLECTRKMAGLVSPEASRSPSRALATSLCPHMVFALCACAPEVSLCVQIFSP